MSPSNCKSFLYPLQSHSIQQSLQEAPSYRVSMPKASMDKNFLSAINFSASSPGNQPLISFLLFSCTVVFLKSHLASSLLPYLLTLVQEKWKQLVNPLLTCDIGTLLSYHSNICLTSEFGKPNKGNGNCFSVTDSPFFRNVCNQHTLVNVWHPKKSDFLVSKKKCF